LTNKRQLSLGVKWNDRDEETGIQRVFMETVDLTKSTREKRADIQESKKKAESSTWCNDIERGQASVSKKKSITSLLIRVMESVKSTFITLFRDEEIAVMDMADSSAEKVDKAGEKEAAKFEAK
jgi:hypothetical protein